MMAEAYLGMALGAVLFFILFGLFGFWVIYIPIGAFWVYIIGFRIHAVILNRIIRKELLR